MRHYTKDQMITAIDCVIGLYDEYRDVYGEEPTNAALSAKADTIEGMAEIEGEWPTVVCLCGSTRFSEAYQIANLTETLAGRIVLTIGCDTITDGELFQAKTDRERERIKVSLDELHKRKIDLSDEILVLNVGGYIGESTRSELEYAKNHGKIIRFLEPVAEFD